MLKLRNYNIINLRELGPPNPVISFPWVQTGPAAETASRGEAGVAAATTHVKIAKILGTRPILPSSTTLSCWHRVCENLWLFRFLMVSTTKLFCVKKIEHCKDPRDTANFALLKNRKLRKSKIVEIPGFFWGMCFFGASFLRQKIAPARKKNASDAENMKFVN